MNATEQACEYFLFEGMTYDSDTGEELEMVEQVEEKARLFLLNL